MNKPTNIHTQTLANKAWNYDRKAFEFTFAFTFKTREQYLEFRRLWKENYALLSQSLRQQKALIRETMRKKEPAGDHQVHLLSLKSEATTQLWMRRESKAESHRQYLAARLSTS